MTGVLHRTPLGCPCGYAAGLRRGHWVIYYADDGKASGCTNACIWGAGSDTPPAKALMLAREHSFAGKALTTCPECYPTGGRTR